MVFQVFRRNDTCAVEGVPRWGRGGVFVWLVALLAVLGLAAGCNSQEGNSGGSKPDDAGVQKEVGPDIGEDIDTGPCIVDQDCSGELICKEGDCVDPRDDKHQSRRKYLDISAGHTHGCGVFENKSIRCWGGSQDYTRTLHQIPDDPRYIAVSASAIFDCALNGSGRARCWGNKNFHGRIDPPDETFDFHTVDAGEHHVCAVRKNGDVHCWGVGSEPASEPREGFLDYNQAVPPDEGDFIDVTAGYTHSCAIKSDHTLECWGQGDDPDKNEGGNDYDQAVPAEGKFIDICAGRYHNCAIRKEDKSITCWGWIRHRTGNYPKSGSFEEIACGRRHHCALHTDGTLDCWGHDEAGETDQPSGTFETVTAGTHFSCALDEEGRATCWGSNAFNKLEAP